MLTVKPRFLFHDNIKIESDFSKIPYLQGFKTISPGTFKKMVAKLCIYNIKIFTLINSIRVTPQQL